MQLKGHLSLQLKTRTLICYPNAIYQRAVENLYKAEFGGLGVSIYPDHRGFIKISKPMPGTPAESAQLQAGDYITKVNGKQIYLGERTGYDN